MQSPFPARYLTAIALLPAVLCLGPAASANEHERGAGEHRHAPPHGGTLVVLGDHVGHLEFVLTEDGTFTMYVFDGEVEEPVRLAQETVDLKIALPALAEPVPLSLEGVENILTGETRGDTSQFAGNAAELQGALRFDVEILRLEYRGWVFEPLRFPFPEGSEGGLPDPDEGFPEHPEPDEPDEPDEHPHPDPS